MSSIFANFTTENFEKRLLNVLFLTTGNSRKISISVKERATVDARGCIASLIPVCLFGRTSGKDSRLIPGVWVSPLLSYADGQCEKPPVVGQQRESDPTLSFYDVMHRGGVRPA